MRKTVIIIGVVYLCIIILSFMFKKIGLTTLLLSGGGVVITLVGGIIAWDKDA